LALQAQRQAFQPKAKYPGETDKFLSEQDQFYQSIGYDPLDYALPAAAPAVNQYVNEQGLPVVTVGDKPAWVGESSARSYYEGSSEDDEYSALALDAMDMIDQGASPLEARRWAAEQVAAAQASNPEAFADLDLADKVLGDVDKYGADLNTRAGVVDKAVLTEGAKGDDFGLFEGGGQYSSGLGGDPLGYERGQAQGTLADYQGIDQAQIARLLQDNLNKDMGKAKLAAGQTFGYDTGDGRAVGGASLNPRRGGLAENVAASKANVAAIAGPSDQDVRVSAAVQAGKNLFSKDDFVRGAARQGYASRRQDLETKPTAGHQELLRRVMATRSAMGLEALPSRPGPSKPSKAPKYNPPKKVEKKPKD
jgi:hypothetical protein